MGLKCSRTPAQDEGFCGSGDFLGFGIFGLSSSNGVIFGAVGALRFGLVSKAFTKGSCRDYILQQTNEKMTRRSDVGNVGLCTSKGDRHRPRRNVCVSPN